MFVIRPDPFRPLLHARLLGLWGLETVDLYGAALGEAIGRRAQAGGRFGLLVDTSGFPIQTVAVAERFGAMLAQWPPPDPDGPLAGVAILTSGALATLQARRTFGDIVAIFQDRAVAAEWLEGQVRAVEDRIGHHLAIGRSG